MALEEYIRKRKFSATPEPAPGKGHKTEATGGFFCVQRHRASHLHYDVRLEVNGALASWAVPKGPTLDSGRKPLAMKVEDHPMEYGDFEGNIPQGNYGAGSVMLWDIGRYRLLDEPTAQQQLDRGDFKFFLEGSKLKGAFALVRMKRGKKGTNGCLSRNRMNMPSPAGIRKTMPGAPKPNEPRNRSPPTMRRSPPPISREPNGPRCPRAFEPMLATLADEPPAGDQWIYELKWDGVRALCFLEKGNSASIPGMASALKSNIPSLPVFLLLSMRRPRCSMEKLLSSIPKGAPGLS